MPSRRIPLVVALLAAALAPPALAADSPARAIARRPAAAPATAPQRDRGEVSPGTADPGKPRQRARPAAGGAGEANVAAPPRPGGSRPDAVDVTRARPVRGTSPQGSTGRQAAGSTRPEQRAGQAAVGPTPRPATRRERAGSTGSNGHALRDTSGRAGEPTAGARGAATGSIGHAPGDRSEEPRSTSCAAALQAAPTLQYEATRASLREFWWSDMARFFETSLDELEPQPTQVASRDTVATDEAIRRSGLNRKLLEQLARSRSVDLLSERELAKIGKALASASPGALEWLLRADSPSLRAYVWNWLATTPAGTCALVRLDRSTVDAAIRDRSVAVEHGEDLIFRPLGDYALAARARVAAADPQNFDALLRTLAQEDIDPRVRAIVAGLRVRRGHAGSIEQGLVDPAASVRGAVAAAALHRDRALYEQRILGHGASDPVDLVTELVVGELLGGPDGAPSGALANSRDPRIRAALNRWRGRGDPMAPLPAPEQPLTFAAPKRGEPARHEARTEPVRGEPARGEPAREEAAEPVEAVVTDDAPHEEHPVAAEPARPGRRAGQTTGGRRLPGILDDPSGDGPLP